MCLVPEVVLGSDNYPTLALRSTLPVHYFVIFVCSHLSVLHLLVLSTLPFPLYFGEHSMKSYFFIFNVSTVCHCVSRVIYLTCPL